MQPGAPPPPPPPSCTANAARQRQRRRRLCRGYAPRHMAHHRHHVQVLNGPWSMAFGVPLTIPGMLAYATVIMLALVRTVRMPANQPAS